MTLGNRQRLSTDPTRSDLPYAVLAAVLATGDVLGRDTYGRTMLALTVDDRLLDELAAYGAEVEDLEPEPEEDDDPGEDEEGTSLHLDMP